MEGVMLIRILLLMSFFCLFVTPLQAEKFYIWIDKADVLNITNHASFAPAHLKSDETDTFPAAPPPGQVIAPGDTPPSRSDQQLGTVKENIRIVEDRNKKLKRIRKFIHMLIPGGTPSSSPAPALETSTSQSTSGSCYNLGYRYGKCVGRSMKELACAPGNDIVIPQECENKPETNRGIKAGFASVNELGQPDKE